MNLSAAVKKEAAHIAIGILIGNVVMLAVFLIVGRMDFTVLLGALLGSGGAMANFLFMCLDAQRAMDNPDRAKTIMQQSYARRMFAMALIMVLGVRLPWFHPLAAILPFLMPSVTIKMMQLLGMYKS